MLEKLKTFVRGVIRKMFPAKSIEQVLDVKPCISSVMQERIEFWHNMYIGMAPWCKNPITSLRKEQGICMEFANVCLNEMESQVSIERLDDIYNIYCKQNYGRGRQKHRGRPEEIPCIF